MPHHRVLRLFAALPVILVCVPLAMAQPAVVRNPIANPTIVNLFWDATWDAHHPGMTMAMINTFTRSLVASTYFAGLAEYVGGAPQTTVSFAGGFPAAGCPSGHLGPAHDGPTAPGVISEVDIQHIVNCQIAAGGQPSGPNVIFNVFIPAGTRELPLWFCSGYTAYHFHSELPPAWGQPFLAIFARPACLAPSGGFANLTDNMTHELVEAITDPRVDRVGSINLEVADLCATSSTPFLLPGAGLVSDYFSNLSAGCLGPPRFSDTTVPAIDPHGVTFQINNPSLNDLTITIHGSGFGRLPPTVASTPVTTNLPYFTLTDTTAASGWTAGNSLPRNDAVTLQYRSWTPGEIMIDGFGGAFGTGGNTAHPHDVLSLTVCNPQSGLCGTPVSVEIPAPPEVTSLTPPGGPARGHTPVTIHGTGFTRTEETRVFFGQQPAGNVVVVDAGTITAEAPPYRPGESAPVRVRNLLGVNTAPPLYNYCGPVLSHVAPSGGPESGGTVVKITGTCLADVAQVAFNSTGATQLHIDSDSQITVTSPAADCLGAPGSGGSYEVDVNAMEHDPSSPLSVSSTDAWSPTTPDTHFTYHGTFPLARCLTSSGIFRSPCFEHPAGCLNLNWRGQLIPAFIGPNPGMRTSFIDLEGVSWANAAIANVASEGVLPGIDAKHFAPEQGVTRGEFVTAMQQLVSAPAPLHPATYVDLKADTRELAAAQALGNLFDVDRVAGGLAFRPAGIVDRQTAAAAVVALGMAVAKIPLLDKDNVARVLAKVPDSKSIDVRFRNFVATAIDAGFFHLPNGVFAPTAPLTRAQLAMLIDRLQVLSK